MAVPSQRTSSPSSLTNGRVNQKLRTRTAIVEAAQRLLDQGDTPTVAAAAEDAMVSRTTAYRYFPTQESLLLELSLTTDMSEVEALVAKPLGDTDAETRVLEVFDLFNRRILANEELGRRAVRAYQDMWIAAREAGSAPPQAMRAGRRMRWIDESLAPLADGISDADLRRMKAALALVGGIEAAIVLRDVCGLDAEEALDVTHWAAEAILTAGLSAKS